MLNLLPRPAIFAHRGASAYAPENTLAAFELALHQGADGIELDTKLSADGHVIVIHDTTVDRTTAGHGRVRELTLAELRRLDAGSHFDVVYQGEPIPTLEEVLKAVGQLTYINIELANHFTPLDDLPDKVAALVKRMKLGRRVLFSSFNPLALSRVRRHLPETPVALLAQAGAWGAWARSWPGRRLGYQALNPAYSDVTAALVRTVHEHGARLYPYTVNQAGAMQQLFALGVDGLITDDPVLARQVLTVKQR